MRLFYIAISQIAERERHPANPNYSGSCLIVLRFAIPHMEEAKDTYVCLWVCGLSQGS